MTANQDIHPQQLIVDSKEFRIAVVDRVEEQCIRVAQVLSGQQRYIPLSWVRFVDNFVHLDRPREQVMREWMSEPIRSRSPFAL